MKYCLQKTYDTETSTVADIPKHVKVITASPGAKAVNVVFFEVSLENSPMPGSFIDQTTGWSIILPDASLTTAVNSLSVPAVISIFSTGSIATVIKGVVSLLFSAQPANPIRKQNNARQKTFFKTTPK